MGQRLNIEIKNNEKVLANCYYHWSGYSTSSLELTKIIIDYINNNEIEYDVKTAINLLELTGATFNEKAWEKAKELGFVDGEYSSSCNRNNGLIAVDKDNMKETREWEEGRITINLESKVFDFDCYSRVDGLDEDMEEAIDNLFTKADEIKYGSEVSFCKIDYLLEKIKEAEENNRGRIKIGEYCYGRSIY